MHTPRDYTAPVDRLRSYAAVLFLWIVVNAFAWCVGMVAGFTLEDTLSRLLHASNEHLWHAIEPLTGLISALIMGLFIGIGQAGLLGSLGARFTRAWFTATLAGFAAPALVMSLFGLHIFQRMECFICIGGFELPPRVLQEVAVWSTFLIDKYALAGPLTAGWIGLGMGWSQWLAMRRLRMLTYEWLVCSTLASMLAFLAGGLITLFTTDVVIVAFVTGTVFALITLFPFLSRLRNHFRSSWSQPHPAS